MSIADDIKRQAEQVFTGEYESKPDTIKLSTAPVGDFTIHNTTHDAYNHEFIFHVVYNKRSKNEIELPSNYIVTTNA